MATILWDGNVMVGEKLVRVTMEEWWEPHRIVRTTWKYGATTIIAEADCRSVNRLTLEEAKTASLMVAGRIAAGVGGVVP